VLALGLQGGVRVSNAPRFVFLRSANGAWRYLFVTLIAGRLVADFSQGDWKMLGHQPRARPNTTKPKPTMCQTFFNSVMRSYHDHHLERRTRTPLFEKQVAAGSCLKVISMWRSVPKSAGKEPHLSLTMPS